ncbi:formylglycine-generating enzyme family protein [Halomarina rubra]|uniref:Formylglycine-generating enzyme family protein n=1 Tax=Halomarina rubra TaxID=2071873 RepID=A0ABD6APZ7_9EURY|nr:formylglycine-generating enzyme family protein [Halomarina rubra]
MASDREACCTPGRDCDAELPPDDSCSTETGEVTTSTGMVRLSGGTFTMGSDGNEAHPEDGEGPLREVTVAPFLIDRCAVTNAEFFRFVDETGYTTDAERYGWSFVFRGFVDNTEPDYVLDTVTETPWWVAVKGATWLAPEGPGSNVLRDRLDHPVVHVSHNDARAYCSWAGKRLLTEAEWEYAARGGLVGARFPWGEDLKPEGEHRCNIWQGTFPEENTAADGYRGTAPVDAYSPNGYGLSNTIGNVWEWCADWFSPTYHRTPAADQMNPTGPPDGTARVMRGGSYLCHDSYCNRYRVAARSQNTADSSTGNLGFRCARDVNSAD